MQTLWENEVLLTRGSFKFPAFQKGNRYRLMIGGMSHVGAGEGFRIYVNGKLLIERERGVGKREGAKPICVWIDESWWPEFDGGEVTIAAISFKNMHKGSSNNHFSVWLQESKIPPLGEKEILNSVVVTPMLSSDWQEKQDPDDLELQSGDDRYHYDGKFTPNPKLPGSWTTVGLVPEIEAFDPEKPRDANRAQLKKLTFKDQGKTDDAFWIWSGDTLMDLDKNQALKMMLKTITGTDYLFVEAGGFSATEQTRLEVPVVCDETSLTGHANLVHAPSLNNIPFGWTSVSSLLPFCRLPHRLRQRSGPMIPRRIAAWMEARASRC